MERELHQRLYSHLELLNMIHPPTEDYKEIFKKDMFAKSNKAAFFHVVHYLLHVLDPKEAKKRLTAWPIYNIKARENKFRAEVLAYLNELNSIYEDANLPLMMSSHLVAPGGYRFVHFMYRLTELVIYEVLEKEFPDEILMRPRPGKNEDFNTKMYENLLKINGVINYETNCAIEKFDKKFKSFKIKAENIISESNAVDTEMREIQKNIEIEQRRFNTCQISNEQILEKIKILQEKSKFVDILNNSSTECERLISHLMEISIDGEALNLIESIQDLNILLKRKLCHLPVYSVPELELYLQQITQKRGELEQAEKQLKNEHESLLEAMETSKDILKSITSDFEKNSPSECI